MLVVSHIHKMDSGTQSPILKNISFTVSTGQRIGIVGAGKSTLLDIISGADTPDKGRIRLKPSSARVGYLNRDNPTLDSVLAANPQILVIDNPAAYLDAAARDSLVECLNDFAGGVVIVSDDTDLLDRVVTHIVAINPDTGRARQFACNYSDYLAVVSAHSDAHGTNGLHHNDKHKPESASRSQQRRARRAEFDARARVNRLNRVNPNR